MGIHVVPNHFYEPIPDTRKISKDFWETPSSLAGIDMREAGQQALLQEFCSKYKPEYGQFKNSTPVSADEFTLANRSFGSVDGEILYCMIRHFKPNAIIEIGSGNSTIISSMAIRKNGEEMGSQAKLTAIEPYPSAVIEKGFPGLTRLIKAPVQSVPLAEFEALGENDILFIDSSHVLKEASDVQFEYLEIVPRLRKGVIVHFHDIFLPFPYPRSWVEDELRFWNEQYVLQAFLSCNNSFEVLWAGSYMNHKHPDSLQQAFPSYRAHETAPGSFWIRRVA
jgi:predicted O-methyltransferase YrrM